MVAFERALDNTLRTSRETPRCPAAGGRAGKIRVHAGAGIASSNILILARRLDRRAGTLGRASRQFLLIDGIKVWAKKPGL